MVKGYIFLFFVFFIELFCLGWCVILLWNGINGGIRSFQGFFCILGLQRFFWVFYNKEGLDMTWGNSLRILLRRRAMQFKVQWWDLVGRVTYWCMKFYVYFLILLNNGVVCCMKLFIICGWWGVSLVWDLWMRMRRMREKLKWLSKSFGVTENTGSTLYFYVWFDVFMWRWW